MVQLVACVGDSTLPADGGLDATTDAIAHDVVVGDVSMDASAPISILQVDLGEISACALTSDGSVWCWGDNTAGELGFLPVGTTGIPPTKVIGLPPAKQVAVGGVTACAVAQSDSRVWCWGWNGNGQLGSDVSTPCPGVPIQSAGNTCSGTPVEVPGLVASSVSVGIDVTCAVLLNGTVACWGLNSSGELAKSVTTNFATDGGVSQVSSAPVAIPDLSNIVQVSTAFPGWTACALDSGGNVWCWGDNTFGSAGHTPGSHGDTMSDGGTTTVTPAQIFMNPDGSGGPFNHVVRLKGGRAPCAVRDDGTVWCWGWNTLGILGSGTCDVNAHPSPVKVPNLSSIVDVRGGNAAYALSDAGQVWFWSGDGAFAFHGTEAPVGACISYANSPYPAALPVTAAPLSGVVTLAGSHVDGVVVVADGGVLEWGGNNQGQLGHPTGTQGDLGDAAAGWGNPNPSFVGGLP